MPLAPVPVNNVDRSGVSGCRSVYMTSLRFASYEFQYYTLFNGEGLSFMDLCIHSAVCCCFVKLCLHHLSV